MRISDWSSDVCSSDLFPRNCVKRKKLQAARAGAAVSKRWNPSTANYCRTAVQPSAAMDRQAARRRCCANGLKNADSPRMRQRAFHRRCSDICPRRLPAPAFALGGSLSSRRKGFDEPRQRSEEHTSELQSLMRISYAVFCLKKTKTTITNTKHKL